MINSLVIDDLIFYVTRKKIKYVYTRPDVTESDASVVVSAPTQMTDEELRQVLVEDMPGIRRRLKAAQRSEVIGASKTSLVIDDLTFHIIRKDIKHVYMRPKLTDSDLSVAVSAPEEMADERLRSILVQNMDKMRGMLSKACLQGIAKKETTLVIEGLTFYITRKNIRHVYTRLKVTELGVSVAVSAPKQMTDEKLRSMLVKDIDSLRESISKIRSSKEIPKTSQQGSLPTITNWLGEAYTVYINPQDGPYNIKVQGEEKVLQVTLPSNMLKAFTPTILDEFYENTVRDIVEKALPSWEKRLGVRVKKVQYKKMTTRWGSCTPAKKRISMNIRLSQYSTKCIEYVLVHELVHLLEISHNSRFYRLMDMHLPSWRKCQKLLKHIVD